MASSGARAYNEGLGAEPERGFREPLGGGFAPEADKVCVLKTFSMHLL